MKKLSSDLAYYRQIGNVFVLIAFFTVFVLLVFKNSPTGQIIFFCIGTALTALMIRALFTYKKLTYSNDTLFIKSYLTGKVTEVPFRDIINIEKIDTRSSYSTMRTGRLIFTDGSKTEKVRFYLAYELYSVFSMSSFIGVGMEPSPAFKAVQNTLTQKKEIDAGKRFISAIIDHMLMTAVIMCFAVPYFFYQFTYIGADGNIKLYVLASGNWPVFILNIGFGLYFCKDCINGQSPAKRIMKFQVVNNNTGEVANPFRCFTRDLFILFWPVEAIMLLINPSRRLGDIVAGTRVEVVDPDRQPVNINAIQLFLVLLLAYPVMPFISFLTDRLMKG